MFVKRLRLLMNRRSLDNACSLFTRKVSEDMTSHDVSAALRPFYFRIHPDKFHQFPVERDINESSFKLLNDFLENLMRNTGKCVSTTVTFFMHENTQASNVTLKKVNIFLSPKEDLPTIITRILSAVQLKNDFVEQRRKQPDNQRPNPSQPPSDFVREFQELRRREKNVFEFIQKEIKRKAVESLKDWLSRNIESAREKQNACKPVVFEIRRLKQNLINQLNLKDLIVDHDWTLSYVKGSLLSLKTLADQHPQQMTLLRHKTVVIGKQTGVNFDGRIVLNIEDVRHNWLNLINSIPKYDKMLSLVPLLVAELSATLNDIEVISRTFGPPVLVEIYLKQLMRIIRSVQDYKTTRGFPIDFPPSLKKFKLIVDNDQGPLMLTPSGHFIVPSSCYAPVFIDFLVDNAKAAEKLLRNHDSRVIEETVVVSQTVYELELQSLDKDDNVTPDLMISCCQNLMQNKERLAELLSDCQLRITTFYSVLQDGKICIPWNWTL